MLLTGQSCTEELQKILIFRGPGGGGGGDATRCVLVNGGKQIEVEMPPDAFW